MVRRFLPLRPLPMPPKLKPINECRKPNGQLSSEAARRLLKRRGGLARAHSRTDGFAPLIAGARKAARRSRFLSLLTKLQSIGFECEHTKALLGQPRSYWFGD